MEQQNPTRWGIVWRFIYSVEGGEGECDQHIDSGIPTKYGLSNRFLTNLWTHQKVWMTMHRMPHHAFQLDAEKAELIAHTWLWRALKIASLPSPWDLLCMDYAFNGGPAIRDLQNAVSAERDGVIGPETIAKTVAALRPQTCVAYIELRLAYLTALSGPHGWDAHGQQWKRRLIRLQHAADIPLPV